MKILSKIRKGNLQVHMKNSVLQRVISLLFHPRDHIVAFLHSVSHNCRSGGYVCQRMEDVDGLFHSSIHDLAAAFVVSITIDISPYETDCSTIPGGLKNALVAVGYRGKKSQI